MDTSRSASNDAAAVTMAETNPQQRAGGDRGGCFQGRCSLQPVRTMDEMRVPIAVKFMQWLQIITIPRLLNRAYNTRSSSRAVDWCGEAKGKNLSMLQLIVPGGLQVASDSETRMQSVVIIAFVHPQIGLVESSHVTWESPISDMNDIKIIQI